MNGILPGFDPLAMRGRADCGPVAMLQLLRHAARPGIRSGPINLKQGAGRRLSGARRIEYDDVLRAWGLRGGSCLPEDMVDRLDTPGHHLRALRRLGTRFAFRRGLGREAIEGALAGPEGGGGRPVALLLPTGTVRWHWIVACGCIPDGVLISAGDGKARPVDWEALERARVRHAASRALGIDGLGYVAGHADSKAPLLFPADRALERDLLRLASVAEEALTPVEPMFAFMRRWRRRWRGAAGRGNWLEAGGVE